LSKSGEQFRAGDFRKKRQQSQVPSTVDQSRVRNLLSSPFNKLFWLFLLCLIHMLQNLEHCRHGICPIVTLKTPQIINRCFTLKTLQFRNRPRRFGIDKLLLAQNYAGNHFAAMHVFQCRRDDIMPIGRLVTSSSPGGKVHTQCKWSGKITQASI